MPSIKPVAPDAEIILTPGDLMPEVIAELVFALEDNFLAWGHKGFDLDFIDKDELKAGPWSLQRVPLRRLIRGDRRRDLLDWFQAEEDKWGTYPYQPQPDSLEGLLAHPIIVGPDWAFPRAEEHTGMIGFALLDGFHRTAAAIRAGITFLDVFVTQAEG